MDNRKFLEILKVCGKLDSVSYDYVEPLGEMDIALDKIWNKLEKTDTSKSDIQLIIGSILNIKDIYERSYYKNKISLTEFANKYIDIVRLKHEYERKRGSITYNILTESAFLSSRYLGDFEDLKVLRDDNYSGMTIRIDGKAIQIKTEAVNIATSYFIRNDTKENIGNIVFIKNGKMKNIRVEKHDDYRKMILALLDSKDYDVALIPFLAHVAKQSILGKVLDDLELDNNSVLRILTMFGLIENNAYDSKYGEIQSMIRDSKIKLSKLVYSLLFKCHMNIQEALQTLEMILGKNDVSQKKIDKLVEVIEVYVNCLNNQLRLPYYGDFERGDLEYNLYSLRNIKMRCIEKLMTDKYTFRVKERRQGEVEFLMIDIYGKNKVQKSIIQKKGKLIGICKDGTIDFNVNGNEKDYIVRLD